MLRFGTPELIILLVIVLLVFGVGRITKIAGEFGSGIRAFRKGIQGDEEESEEGDESPAEKGSKDV